MLIQPDPILTEMFLRHERDRTLRKAEQYELHRALREAKEQARAQRRAERTGRRVRTIRPRTGHRRPVTGRIRTALRHV